MSQELQYKKQPQLLDVVACERSSDLSPSGESPTELPDQWSTIHQFAMSTATIQPTPSDQQSSSSASPVAIRSALATVAMTCCAVGVLIILLKWLWVIARQRRRGDDNIVNVHDSPMRKDPPAMPTPRKSLPPEYAPPSSPRGGWGQLFLARISTARFSIGSLNPRATGDVTLEPTAPVPPVPAHACLVLADAVQTSFGVNNEASGAASVESSGSGGPARTAPVPSLQSTRV